MPWPPGGVPGAYRIAPGWLRQSARIAAAGSTAAAGAIGRHRRHAARTVRAFRVVRAAVRFRLVFEDEAFGEIEVLIVGGELLDAEHVEGGRAGAPLLRGVALQGRPGAEVDLGGPHFDLEIVVAEHLPQDAVRLVAGLAEDGAIGLAHELLPALVVLLRPSAQLADGHADPPRGVVPAESVGAVFGGEEQGIVEEIGAGIGLGCDHGNGPADVNGCTLSCKLRIGWGQMGVGEESAESSCGG